MAGRTDAMKQPVTPKAAPAAAPIIAEGLSREEKLAAWVQKNGKFLAIAGGVVALVVLVTWFMSASAKRKENYARQALEQALGRRRRREHPTGLGRSPEGRDQFRGDRRRFRGGTVAQPDPAPRRPGPARGGRPQAVHRTRPAGPFAAPANMLLGGALENLGKPTEAIPAYEAANAAATLDHLKAEALLGVARAARSAGQKDKALAALREVVEKYKETAAFPVAEVRLGEIAASN